MRCIGCPVIVKSQQPVLRDPCPLSVAAGMSCVSQIERAAVTEEVIQIVCRERQCQAPYRIVESSVSWRSASLLREFLIRSFNTSVSFTTMRSKHEVPVCGDDKLLGPSDHLVRSLRHRDPSYERSYAARSRVLLTRCRIRTLYVALNRERLVLDSRIPDQVSWASAGSRVVARISWGSVKGDILS